MTPTTYRLDPIDDATATRLRAEGGVRHIADSKPGFPCRQCMRDAEIGDALILIAHDPFDDGADSPYRATSPIFLHEEPCTPPSDLTRLPDQLTIRQLSVRAFDGDAMMIDAEVVAGDELDAALRRLFDDDAIDHVQIHNASPGCWATSVRRAIIDGNG